MAFQPGPQGLLDDRSLVSDEVELGDAFPCGSVGIELKSNRVRAICEWLDVSKNDCRFLVTSARKGSGGGVVDANSSEG